MGQPKEGYFLEIPTIGVKEKIGESKGDPVWFAGSRDLDQNVVIAGHRFLYSDPFSPPFFFLDRLKESELIFLEYGGERYTYSVLKNFEASKRDVWIKKGYSFPSITLYTCTPIYNPISRLVVVGRLVSIE